jgi:tripartite-type tricarboxylate transporter receptor subunit TctC
MEFPTQVFKNFLPQSIAITRGFRRVIGRTVTLDAENETVRPFRVSFAAKLFNKRGGLGFVEVPYRSSAQMIQDVASGLNQVMMSSIAAATAVVQTGRVRQLAVTADKRFPGLPDLPALQEIVPGVVMNGFFAIVAPAGTPQAVIAPLNAEIGKYVENPDIQNRLLSLGLVSAGNNSPEYAADVIRQEQEQWRAFGKELNVEPQ